MQFFGNINRLRAMRRTLVAPGTMVGLPQFGYTSVISYEKSTACFPIILILAAFRHISFIDTFIVMYQYGRNVNSIRARHAVLAVVARYGGVLHHQICRIIQILSFLFREWYQWRVSTDVILQMFHISHAAQHCQYILGRTGITECPRRHTAFGFALLQPCHNMVGDIGEPPPSRGSIMTAGILRLASSSYRYSALKLLPEACFQST